MILRGNTEGSLVQTQKGTVGYKPHRANMPFSTSGLIPDIILNPNAIPKRMTIGQLIECLMGKVCAIKGVYGDATPFMGVDINKMNDDLVAAGYEEWGNETMYSGMTGQKMNTKIFIGPTYYQRLKQMVGDKAHCATLDHEVLTLDGWKFHNQLSTNDKVATLVDNKLVYQHPTKILYYPNYKGDMYHIKTQQIDLMVTPNHRMWVSKEDKYDFELAENIVGQYRKYKKDTIWDMADYQFVLQNVGNLDMNYWLILFGIWITKGSLDNKSHQIYTYRNEEWTTNALISAVVKLGFSYEQRDDKIIIINDELYTYLKQFEDKSLPNWVWALSSFQARKLLESIVSSNYTGDVYFTYNVKLADDIMRLALHCGWSADKFIPMIKDTIGININKSNNNCEVNNSLIKNAQTEEIIKDYNEPVFCLEVPGGVFYVRRNGKAVWTGNSRARGPTQLLTRRIGCLSHIKSMASLRVCKRHN